MFELSKESFMQGVAIKTTQNVQLEYEAASVGERILAIIIDFAVYFTWFILATMLLDVFKTTSEIGGILMSLPILFYHLLCELFMNGQSIGKRTLKIRVVKMDGSQPSLSNYLMRWIFRLIDCSASLGSVATICILINGKGQRLGDIAAGTTVVRIKRSTKLRDIRPAELPPDYQVTYTEVLMLNDQEIATIKRILRKSVQTGKLDLLPPLAEKVSRITGIQPRQQPYGFLTTVLNDYHYLSNSSTAETW